MAKPAPINSYENCRGQSPVGTHVCADREFCKRFEPNHVRANFKDFWLAKACPKFEAKERAVEEPAKVEW